MIRLHVNHFLEFVGKPKNNYYQIKKLVKVCKSLQTSKDLTQNFVTGNFRSYIIFPYLKLKKLSLSC